MKKYILWIFILAIVLVIFLPQFLIKVKIVCRSQEGQCSDSIMRQISYLEGKREFFAKRKLEKTLDSDFAVSEFSTQFKLPNILQVDLINKIPLFAFKNISTDKFYLSDSQGLILSVSDQTNLPYLETQESLPSPGEKVDFKNLLALQLIDGLYTIYQTKTGRIEGDALLVDLPGGLRVIFPLVDADRELLLGSLKLIYSNISTGEGENLYREIDLRYKNPVLR